LRSREAIRSIRVVAAIAGKVAPRVPTIDPPVKGGAR
jgi:hypothetical protein